MPICGSYLAKAGELIAQLDTTIPYYTSRTKKPDLDQVSSTEDLKDYVHFGRYDCHWKGCDFYMYEARYAETKYSDVSNHYILSPCQHAQESNGRSLVADELLVAAFQHSTEVNKEIWLFDDGYWRRSEKLWEDVEKASWDDVVLNKELGQEINNNVSSFFDRKESYKSFGIPWKRGIVLHGLPGNGKTISIKAIMRSLSLHPTPIPTLLDVGISKRPSRFDRKYHFPLPAFTERVRYCEYWRSKLAKNASIGFPAELPRKIAEASEGLSFAYLQEIFVASMFAVMERAEATNPMATSIAQGASDLSQNFIWQAVNAQITKVRKELEDGRKSIEDVGKNSVVRDAASGNTRRTGFTR